MDNIIFSLPEMDNFICSAFQQHPFLFTASEGYKLIDWEMINHLLEKDILDFPRVRLANDSNPAIRGFRGFLNYSLTVTGEKSPHVNRYNLLKNLQSGSTLIIDRCQAFFEPVRLVTDYLSTTLRCRTSANLYCSWSATPSFGIHFDNHDVIALQIEGSKIWEIYSPTHPYPLLSDKSFDFTPPQGPPEMTWRTSPGQAIYLPAGYWHNVKTEGDRSLHISFPVIRPRKIDVVRSILDSLSRYPEMRQPIAYDSCEIDNTGLHEVLETCLKDVDIELWESAIVEDCIRQGYIKFNLPDIRTRDV
ncbi:JmjC domain-containing protein [Klebsiella variicola]|uniref:JmjC domain-containing protein n=1 Tax=Klebsiella variicola TaxID=244366 RepID=UPI0003BFBC82|nr:cupin domain-containing protein [Klebsiella variicola]ESN40838.1 hypothetical protein L366_03253 [Klebsiella variicola]